MKLSISSGGVRRAVGEKLFLVMKECGFDACDLDLASAYGKTDEALRAYCQKIRALADEAGVEIGQTHAGYKYPREVGNEWQASVDQAIDAIKATGYLGVKYCVVHPVRFPGRVNNRFVEENYKKAVEFYEKLIPYLEEYNVVCCIENMWDRDPIFDRICATILSRATEMVRMCDELNAIAPGRFGICVDTGHCELTQDPSPEMLRLCGNRVKALHCHDTDGISDLHTIPYSIHSRPAGVDPVRTDWEDVMHALKEIGYEGTLNFEVAVPEPAAIVPAGMRYLAKIGAYFRSLYEAYDPNAKEESAQ
jgi:sugar phosphate isomerase/epimerase